MAISREKLYARDQTIRNDARSRRYKCGYPHVHSLNEVYSSLSQRRRYEVWFLRPGLADGSGAWWLRYLLSSPGRGGCAGETRVDPVQKALMDVVMQRADHKPATARAPRAEGKEAAPRAKAAAA